MWNAGMEVNGFDRTNSFISHYHGGAWDTIAAAAASSMGSLYTMTRTGITSLSPFMVADRTTFTTSVPTVLTTEISLYPNPTSNTLYFSSNVDAVDVYDVSGKKVTSVNGSTNQISVQDLAAGTYMVRFTTNNTTTVRKFVKE
jgi:type IX secretion system substrate protein